MIEVISSAFSSLSAAKDLVKAIDGVRTENALMALRTELLSLLLNTQESLLDAQQTMGAMAARKADLEQQIVELEEWSAEAAGYEPANTGRGPIAYRRTGTEPDGDSGEWLCPNCFHAKKKSYLIPEILYVGRTHILRCHPCGLEIVTRGVRSEPAPSARRR